MGLSFSTYPASSVDFFEWQLPSLSYTTKDMWSLLWVCPWLPIAITLLPASFFQLLHCMNTLRSLSTSSMSWDLSRESGISSSTTPVPCPAALQLIKDSAYYFSTGGALMWINSLLLDVYRLCRKPVWDLYNGVKPGYKWCIDRQPCHTGWIPRVDTVTHCHYNPLSPAKTSEPANPLLAQLLFASCVDKGNSTMAAYSARRGPGLWGASSWAGWEMLKLAG